MLLPNNYDSGVHMLIQILSLVALFFLFELNIEYLTSLSLPLYSEPALDLM